MNGFCQNEIKAILEIPDSEEDSNIPNELFGVVYCLGRDVENDEEFTYAFDILLMLSNRKNAKVRSWTILAFSLLATFNGHLNRSIVEPIICWEWKIATPENKCTIQNAVNDINFALGWNMQL